MNHRQVCALLINLVVITNVLPSFLPLPHCLLSLLSRQKWKCLHSLKEIHQKVVTDLLKITLKCWLVSNSPLCSTTSKPACYWSSKRTLARAVPYALFH